MQVKRRTFIRALVMAGVAGGVGTTRAQQAAPKILLGICSGPENAGKLKAVGFEFIEGAVGGILKPNMPDAEFAPLVATLTAGALPIRSCNGLLSKEFRLTGPDARHNAALDYAVKACQRADALGIPYIVLGSGGARNVPADFDLAKGKEQFIGFCQKLGERIKDCRVTIVLEPLNKAESNILNSVDEGIGYVDAIGSPRIQLLADFYHMMKEREGPDAIRRADTRIRHCHVAELEGRKAPGTKGEDLRGFFNALRDIGYAGGVSCECSWPKDNVEQAWKKALTTLRES